MDQRRVDLFNRALSEMTNDICGPAAPWQTVTTDLGLVESQAGDVIRRFLTYCEDFMFLVNSGLIEAPPEQGKVNGSSHAAADDFLYMVDSGVIFDVPPELNLADREEPKVYPDQIIDVPVSKAGVKVLEEALAEGKYVEFFIRPYTCVMDVVDFVKGIELMAVLVSVDQAA